MGADDVHLSSGPANKFFYMLAEGTAAQDHRRPGARREPRAPAPAHRHRPRQRGEDLVARAHAVHDLDHELHRRPRRHHPRGRWTSNDAQCAAVEAAWDAVDVPAGYWTCADGQLDEGASVLGANPGFESGAAGWTLGGTAEVTNDPNLFFPHSGTRWAVFNGFGDANNVATASRTVTVPNTATATLRFHLFIISNESNTTAFDTFDVLVNGTPVGAAGHFDNRSQNNTYIRYDVPMAACANQSVTLGFRGQEDATSPPCSCWTT